MSFGSGAGVSVLSDGERTMERQRRGLIYCDTVTLTDCRSWPLGCFEGALRGESKGWVRYVGTRLAARGTRGTRGRTGVCGVGNLA